MYIRPLTEGERQTLQEGLRSSTAFVWRRCQLLLARARGQTARVMGEVLGCDAQTVRKALQACNTQGLAALPRRSSAPQRTPPAAVDAPRRAPVRALWHQSPRTFGTATRLWTFPLAAEVGYAEGLTPRQGSGDTLRRAWACLGVRWQRATHWIPSPEPAYVRKKNGATG